MCCRRSNAAALGVAAPVAAVAVQCCSPEVIGIRKLPFAAIFAVSMRDFLAAPGAPRGGWDSRLRVAGSGSWHLKTLTRESGGGRSIRGLGLSEFA